MAKCNGKRTKPYREKLKKKKRFLNDGHFLSERQGKSLKKKKESGMKHENSEIPTNAVLNACLVHLKKIITLLNFYKTDFKNKQSFPKSNHFSK